jgi:hypothetical protein
MSLHADRVAEKKNQHNVITCIRQRAMDVQPDMRATLAPLVALATSMDPRSVRNPLDLAVQAHIHYHYGSPDPAYNVVHGVLDTLDRRDACDLHNPRLVRRNNHPQRRIILTYALACVGNRITTSHPDAAAWAARTMAWLANGDTESSVRRASEAILRKIVA